MTMQVIAAVAEFERDLLVERTQAGLARAKVEGKSIGWPGALTESQREDVVRRLDSGAGLLPVPPWPANTPRAGKPSYERAPPRRRDFGQRERRHAREDSASDHRR